MESKPETVTITYSAEEQKELRAIRAKYAPKENRPLTSLEQARAIDTRVESKALITGLAVGITGTLIAGLGMSCVLVWDKLALGIVIGLAGIAGAAAAWPLYPSPPIQPPPCIRADAVCRHRPLPEDRQRSLGIPGCALCMRRIWKWPGGASPLHVWQVEEAARHSSM